MRIHAHAAPALGCDVRKFLAECAFFVKELFGFVAAHPVFEQAQMIGFLAQFRKRNLVSAPGSSTGLPSTSFGPVQPLGVRIISIGQAGRSVDPPSRAAFWIVAMRSNIVSKHSGSLLMHRRRVVALDREGLISVAAHQLFKLRVWNAREHSRVRDLVAVQGEG